MRGYRILSTVFRSHPRIARRGKSYISTSRSSGSRINLLAAPSHPDPSTSSGLWTVDFYAAFVPGYSGGSATALHRLPLKSISDNP